MLVGLVMLQSSAFEARLAWPGIIRRNRSA
jgi:hypothetical protein